MSDPAPGWIDEACRIARRAPAWMRDRASVELHVGGFTRARVDAPVVDVSDLETPGSLEPILTFFLVVAAASDARVARIQGLAGEDLVRAISSVRDILGSALLRMDEENAPLLRYLDVHLGPPSQLDGAETSRLLRALRQAVDDPNRRSVARPTGND